VRACEAVEQRKHTHPTDLRARSLPKACSRSPPILAASSRPPLSLPDGRCQNHTKRAHACARVHTRTHTFMESSVRKKRMPAHTSQRSLRRSTHMTCRDDAPRAGRQMQVPRACPQNSRAIMPRCECVHGRSVSLRRLHPTHSSETSPSVASLLCHPHPHHIPRPHVPRPLVKGQPFPCFPSRCLPHPHLLHQLVAQRPVLAAEGVVLHHEAQEVHNQAQRGAGHMARAVARVGPLVLQRGGEGRGRCAWMCVSACETERESEQAMPSAAQSG